MSDPKTGWFRRKVPWWARWLIYAGVVIVLFYVVEDTRGWIALNKAKKAYLASGRSLDINEILGPPPPDEENFGAVDFILELYESKGKADVFPGLEIDFYKYDWESRERKPGLYWAEPPLAGLVPEGVSGGTKEDIATYILERLDEFKDGLNRIETAMEREDVRYPRPEKLNVTQYHLNLFHRLHNIYLVRSKARYLVGDYSGSIEDWKMNLSLAERFNDGSGLIGYTIESAFYSLTLDHLWHLLEKGLNERELLAVLTDLKRVNFQSSDFKTVVDIETARYYEYLTFCRINRNEVVKLLPYFMPDGGWLGVPADYGGDLVNEVCTYALAYLSPRGWFWQNQAFCLNCNRGSFRSVKSKRVYHIFYHSLIGDLTELPDGSNHRIIAKTNLAILAVKLELHKIAHGSYPPDLSSLDPPSPNYGYQLSPKNGRPVIYHHEVGPRDVAIDETRFDTWKIDHLWRYPDD